MPYARDERHALVESMRAVGPDAPTLCGDWTARDLAAHLVLRERRLDAAPGIMVSALEGYTERVQRSIAAREWKRASRRRGV
ncbi:maleylpyruvate isomerase family mycothiol-dependent enzyme, partial [Rhodococcus hoagii]|nr:maleylpyruvate isomerase family mycothiol-dependent enzyme [Prescottella equi]